MRNLPPMAAVRVFEAAARAGNFTRAGEELGMTQAAVSYQLKLLEARLGAPLFRRSGRGVVLTPLGERIAPLVTGAFDTLVDAFAVVQRENDGVLTISTFNSLASNWLAARIGEFQIANPDIAVRLKIEDAVTDLNAGDADVGIRGGAVVDPGLAAHFLMRVPVAPLASPALIARYPAVKEPGDVLRLPLLSPDDVWWRWWLKQAGGTPAGEAMRGVRLDSQILEGNAAVAGQGVAMLNPTLWRTQLDAGQLVQVHPFVGMDRTVVRLVYPEYRRSVPKIRAFRQWLLREVDGARADDPFGAFIEA
ncbi:LysR substrate-binding domain-containing protein [Sphingomonas sp. 3-13AW]|jgi:LysR family glycine cleavage system transcriptional activator|uniref:LysR substrate-binding domain-containing protein n=1 Tax=Sphingomonas sp. 3-13AW TaxID=3050450 RepID=UPI003BB4C8A5